MGLQEVNLVYVYWLVGGGLGLVIGSSGDDLLARRSEKDGVFELSSHRASLILQRRIFLNNSFSHQSLEPIKVSGLARSFKVPPTPRKRTE